MASSVWFTRSNNLYDLALDTGFIEQLTNIETASGGPPAHAQNGRNANATDEDEKKGTASQETLKKEQRELLDIIRQRAARREEEKERKKRENPIKAFKLEGTADRRLAGSEPGRQNGNRHHHRTC